jgi:hypothetical protein
MDCCSKRLLTVSKCLFCLLIVLAYFPDLEAKRGDKVPRDEYSWMDGLIERDFAQLPIFSKAKLLEIPSKARITNTHPYWGFFHYQIRNNCVEGGFPTACRKMLEILCQNYTIPDCDLLYYAGDVCESGLDVPVFTGARRKGVKNTILFVDFYFGGCAGSLIGEWQTVISRVNAKLQRSSWRTRKPIAIWRGTFWKETDELVTSTNWHRFARGSACWLSLFHPELIDAAFHVMYDEVFDPYSVDMCRKKIPCKPVLSLEQQMDYKYQLQLIAHGPTFSRDWQFYSESLVFVQEGFHRFELFWYPLLRPWVHYIPIRDDCADLVEKIRWARSHDQEVHLMALQARALIQGHLMPQHIIHYCYKVLMRYIRLVNEAHEIYFSEMK